LDIKGVDLVVNYDLPDDPEGYVHRIGRTGRAGTSGKAFGLVSDRDVEALQRIEEYLKEKVKIGWMEETDLVKEFKPLPTDDGNSGDRGGFKPRQQGGQGGGRNFNNRNGPRPQANQGGNRNFNNNRNGPRPNNNEGSHGQVADSRDAGSPQQHRDRRLGRHGHNRTEQSNQNGQQQKPNFRSSHHKGFKNSDARPGQNRNGQNQNRNAHNPRHQQHAQTLNRRPLKPKDQAGGSEEGLIKKVKGFFSRLFR
jgi:ATP-dependent RNA helicase RhlB